MLACPWLRVNSGDGQAGTFQDETMKEGEVPLERALSTLSLAFRQ